MAGSSSLLFRPGFARSFLAAAAEALAPPFAPLAAAALLVCIDCGGGMLALDVLAEEGIIMASPGVVGALLLSAEPADEEDEAE